MWALPTALYPSAPHLIQIRGKPATNPLAGIYRDKCFRDPFHRLSPPIPLALLDLSYAPILRKLRSKLGEPRQLYIVWGKITPAIGDPMGSIKSRLPTYVYLFTN